MTSPSGVKTHWTWTEWQQSRAARRAVAERISPKLTRRRESSADAELRAAFDGQRGPPFAAIQHPPAKV